ncbi:MAG TPA: FliA/WhiG family RNA polymerase sigma factor [Phycisphaerae bacterium]|jgi:RNA polymerase sigma factor for flagellar operon FliA|nr:FliA/WhiG family RNA polymerase sigma factor [Phycisphaerae bacterium]
MVTLAAASSPCTDALAANDAAAQLAALWESYTLTRDEALRNRLLLHYLYIAKVIARRMRSRLPAGADVDDLTQAATLGLREAIATYDASRGVKFEHYCGSRVRGAALDYLRSLDWAPRMLRARMQRVQETALQLEMQSGQAPSDEQLSEAMNMPLDELQSVRRETAAPLRLRLTTDEESDAGGSSGGVNLNSLPDDNPVDPVREAQRSDLREFLSRGLSAVERQVVILYYYENFSFKEIGATLDLCESRVSQIHQAVMVRLRERVHRIGGTSMDD